MMILFSVVFFSVCGYKMFNFFGLKRAELDNVYLMWKKIQSPNTYWDFICDVGVPLKTITDNAKEFLSSKWQKVN